MVKNRDDLLLTLARTDNDIDGNLFMASTYMISMENLYFFIHFKLFLILNTECLKLNL